MKLRSDPSLFVTHVHPEEPSADEQALHVWLVDLDSDQSRQWFPESIASVEEREHAQRFRQRLHGRRFLASRVMVRRLLGHWLRQDPHELVLATNSWGKPYLAQGGKSLFFNLTHSENLAACVISSASEVGIDLEVMRAPFDIQAVADSHFKPSEAARLRQLGDADSRLAFFQCWTLKEAFAKALGRGIAFGLEMIEVLLEEQPPAVACTAQSRRLGSLGVDTRSGR